MKFVKASLCLSVALALSACGEQASLESHLTNAKSYLSQNKVNESIIELKNAIRLDSKNGEARFLLGQVYLSLGDGLSAVKELERAQSLNYAENKVLPLLARAYILTDSDSDVLALSTSSSGLASEERSQYLAYQTLAALRSEQPKLAKQSVELSQSLAQEGVYSMLASAYYQLSENKYDEAKTLILRILAINAKQVDALMLQGQVAMATKDYQLAADSFKQYFELQPRFGIVQLLLANALLKAGEYQEAEENADAILAKVSSQPFAHYIKAMVRFQEKDFAKASEHGEAALSADFNQPNLKLVVGASAYYLKNWQQSHHNLSSVVKHLPSDHQARRMLAVAQLELGMVDAISTTLNDFDSNDADDSLFLSSLSYKLLERGAMTEAKQLLAKSENNNSESAVSNARQGILKLMMNDPSGLEDLEDAVKLDPEFSEAELAFGFASLQIGLLEEAKAIADKWQAKYPNKVGGYNLIASIAIKEQKYTEAEQTLKQSLTLDPDNLFALTEQLRIAIHQKNDALSKDRADYLINIAPDSDKVLRQYFGVYQNDMALARLASAYELDKDNINKAILLSEAMVSLKQQKQAKELLVSIADRKNLPKRYWQLLVLIYKNQKDERNTRLTLEKWFKENPNHIEAVVLLTDLYAGQRNYERALNVIKQGIVNNDNLLLQLIKMQLLLDSQQITPAKNLYKTLATKNINEALKQGMLGRIFLLEENYVQAVPKLEVLYKAYPSSQNAIYLADAHVRNKYNEKASQVLEHFLTLEPNEDRIKTMLAGVYLENNTNKAITIYDELVKKQPKNIIAHNNLAWLYLEGNKIEQALVHAKKAYELAPHIANIADTYGKVLLGSGEKDTALKYATKASELAKGRDVDIQLNYVEALIANNHPKEAKDVLTKVITTTDEQKNKKAQLQTKL
ncbi:MAG: PEP-CTERM system TPR-repeat protein PrsT [Colwellia sp.]|nr:PEP-CTERM system TPR-repeat protein PrsT [Colwellia sp.]